MFETLLDCAKTLTDSQIYVVAHEITAIPAMIIIFAIYFISFTGIGLAVVKGHEGHKNLFWIIFFSTLITGTAMAVLIYCPLITKWLVDTLSGIF